MENNIVHLEHVSKIYGSGDTEVRALDDVTVDFGEAEFTGPVLDVPGEGGVVGGGGIVHASILPGAPIIAG